MKTLHRRCSGMAGCAEIATSTGLARAKMRFSRRSGKATANKGQARRARALARAAPHDIVGWHGFCDMSSAYRPTKRFAGTRWRSLEWE
jgi:hypothetical protein